VGDDRGAAWEKLVVVAIWTRLDVAWDADRFNAYRRSQGEDCVHCLTGDRVADSLDEGNLTLHHGRAEAEEDERSHFRGASFVRRSGDAKWPGVEDVGGIVRGEIEPLRDGHHEQLGRFPGSEVISRGLQAEATARAVELGTIGRPGAGAAQHLRSRESVWEVHKRDGGYAGRFPRRDPGGQHAVDDHQVGPQLRRDCAHVEGDLRPGGDRHHLGGLLLERDVRVWIGTAPVADDIEARVDGRLTRGRRRENADTAVAKGEQRARGEERRQIPSACPAHDQNIKTRRALVHASRLDPVASEHRLCPARQARGRLQHFTDLANAPWRPLTSAPYNAE
jgi:hypothetical protein